MKKTLLIIFILALAGLGGLRAVLKTGKTPDAPRGAPPGRGVAVESAPVQKGEMLNVKKFSGSLAPRSRFVVASKASGRLEKLFVDMGDSIENGGLAALLDDREYAQNVEQARAELEVAGANVAEAESSRGLAEREFERVTALYDKKIASESELERAEAAYKVSEARLMVARAQVRQREAALEAAEVRLSFTRIRPSWDGGGQNRIVGERYVDEGAMLNANDPIVSVLDIDCLTAVIHVTEMDYFKMHPGRQVLIFSDALPGRTFTGKVVRVSPELRESTRTARVEVEVPNPGHLLKPGMFIRAEVELARHEQATFVPLSALVTRGGKQGVFLLDMEDMKAFFVQVETGIVTRDSAEILKPALEGRVVTLGQHLLIDGSSVILPGTGAEPDSPSAGGGAQ